MRTPARRQPCRGEQSTPETRSLHRRFRNRKESVAAYSEHEFTTSVVSAESADGYADDAKHCRSNPYCVPDAAERRWVRATKSCPCVSRAHFYACDLLTIQPSKPTAAQTTQTPRPAQMPPLLQPVVYTSQEDLRRMPFILLHFWYLTYSVSRC